MTFLLRTWAIFVVALKRLWAQKWLALATLVGLVVAIALTLSIPLYADAIYYRIFRDELSTGGRREGETITRPPFAFMFRYIGSWEGPLDWEKIQQVDHYFSNSASSVLGLPQQLFVRYVKTDNFRLFPQEDIAYADTKDPLEWVSLGFVSDIQDHITLTEGEFPATAAADPDSPLEVLMSEVLATELGVQVGESYITFNRRDIDGVSHVAQFPVRISGIWRATDVEQDYWFYRPDSLDNVLLLPQESFLGRIRPEMREEVYLALWYFVLDGTEVHAAEAGSLATRITSVQQQSNALLAHTSLDVSPIDALQEYRQAVSLLTILLYAFSVPILVLVLTFINLVVTLAVGRRHNEIAILRSRGATALQVIGMAVLEGLILGFIALAIGLPLGELIAQIIGQTRTFLNFSAPNDLQVSATITTWQIGLLAVLVAVVAQVIPTIGASRHTIITYKRERARSLQAPWWQRMWLDLLLLLPAGYGTYLMQQQGSIILAQKGEVLGNNPFQNPLLFLVPALGIIALTLLFLRLLPYFMAILAWLASHIGGVGILLATRQLARSPGIYTGPMLLLVLTLSLSAFTASLAQTLDYHLFDQLYYQIGADISLVEFGEDRQSSYTFGAGSGGNDNANSATEKEDSGPRWLFIPVSEYLKVPGVQAASRVGDYEALTELSGGRQDAIFMGVDRLDFPKVSFWRWDFAPSQLGELMNTLAMEPHGILLPRPFMRQHALHVGDIIQVTVRLYGELMTMDMKVMGGFDLFPKWYPQDGPLIVGNLDYLFERAGGQNPYDVWMQTDPNLDYYRFDQDLRDLNPRAVQWKAPLPQVAIEQQQPERQGLFGVLSVGFVAAGILTVLGFLLYALFSFRQRFIELGVLRAIGLSSAQMAIFLAWELAFLIMTGLVLGTVLGVWSSQLFIPYLQVGSKATALTPPFLVEIAWPAIFRIYLLFGILFLAALSVLTALLLRMRIFEAVKLGETV